MFFETLILASHNPGKLAEFSQLLGPLGLAVCSPSAYGITATPEPHFTFIENALTKARHVARLTGHPTLADDSGLCVDALHGAPGVHSARYAGEPASDKRNNEKLLATLRQSGLGEDAVYHAHYVCVLLYLRDAEDPCPLVVQAQWQGQIIQSPKGEHGFGYDPYFFLPELHRTAAQLTIEEKNQRSHRGQAMRLLVKKLHHLFYK